MTALSKLIPCASALALMATCPPAAWAQQVSPSNPAAEELEEIIVTGFRASLEASLNMKRESLSAVDTILAEDIGGIRLAENGGVRKSDRRSLNVGYVDRSIPRDAGHCHRPT